MESLPRDTVSARVKKVKNETLPLRVPLVLSPAFRTAGDMSVQTVPPPEFPARADLIFVRAALPIGEQLLDQFCDALFHLDSALDIVRQEWSDERFIAIRPRLQHTFDELNAMMKELAD